MYLGPSLRALLEDGDESVMLDAVALDVARIEFPDLDPAAWMKRLDEHASEVSARGGASGDGGCRGFWRRSSALPIIVTVACLSTVNGRR